MGSTPEVAVVAQMDRTGTHHGYNTSNGDWTDTRRFYVTPGMTPTAPTAPASARPTWVDPATLVGFVQWAMATYPADHYALILWDHGSGWRSRALDDPLTQGIAYDDTSGGDGIDMLELRSALSTLTGGGVDPFELIGMDACLMAMIEVDNQLRPYADVRVTSQETEPNDGVAAGRHPRRPGGRSDHHARRRWPPSTSTSTTPPTATTEPSRRQTSAPTTPRSTPR